MAVDGSVHLAKGIDTESDAELFTLGHEVAHAMQQRRGDATTGTLARDDRARLETEADQAGRAAVAGEQFDVCGRAPATVALFQAAADSVEAQWEKDWNDPEFASLHRHFARDDRPPGTPKERYLALCPLYLHVQGIKRPLQYINENIVTARFFDLETLAHKDVAEGLKNAEVCLRLKGFTRAPVASLGGFVARTQTGDKKWSNHAAGLAIDLDPGTNPHLTSKPNRLVISALTGMNIEAANPGKDAELSLYDALVQASDRFKEKFNEEDLAIATEHYRQDAEALDANIDELVDFVAVMPKGREASADNKAWRAELEAKIKRLKRDRRTTEATYKALSRALAKYRQTDASIEKLRLKVDQKQDAVIELNTRLVAAVTSGDGTEIKRLKRELRKAVHGAEEAAKKQRRAEQKRDKEPLRHYAAKGFITLPEDLVETLRDAMENGGGGFTWGGEWHAKDIMHFQKSR